MVVNLANSMAEDGFDVHLVLVKGGGALLDDVAPAVRVINLNKNRVWLAVGALVSYLDRERPAICFSVEDPVNLLAVAASGFSKHKVRLVLGVQSNITMYANTGEVWYGKLIPHLIRRAYRRADVIVAVSHGVRDDLDSIAPGIAARTKVIYNPIVDDGLLEQQKEQVEHDWLGDPECRVILAVGRLTLQKDFSVLLRAFFRVRMKEDVRLVIVGDGNQRANLEAEIAELDLRGSVDLVGFQMNPVSFMMQADLFVLSSAYEGFGNVLVEALACGCPIVSTDCPSGPREILADGQWGRLVPVGDEVALAEAIVQALNEEHDSEYLRMRAMDFTVERAVEQYLDVFFPSGTPSARGSGLSNSPIVADTRAQYSARPGAKPSVS